MILRNFLSVLAGVSVCLQLAAQDPTVGVVEYSTEASPGYTMWAIGGETLLIDNCGRLCYTWQSLSDPGLSVYLLEDGNLLRTKRLPNNVFTGGGGGGGAELLDSDSNVLWSAEFTSETYYQHHDIALLPNGNILVLLWELIEEDEAISLGRDPGNLLNGELWTTMIWEVEPVGSDDYNIVWEWHIKDHLVQSYDSELPHFGLAGENPQWLDVNAGGPGADWLHTNGIDYNPLTDEILLSVRNMNEVFILSHNSTSEEAAGEAGDFLWRWGNPINYGITLDQILSLQHNAEWIPEGYPGAGNITIFNNGNNFGFSSIVEVAPEMNKDGTYAFGAAFEPIEPTWQWSYDTAPSQFYSHFISGAHRCSNGNYLACEGDNGRFWEVSQDGDVVWKYVNPMLSSGNALDQGDVIIPGIGPTNQTFRARRYPPDYPGLSGLDLTPGERIEGNPDPLPEDCMDISVRETERTDALIYPNPVANSSLVNLGSVDAEYIVVDGNGRRILQGKGQQFLAPSSPGIYHVHLTMPGHTSSQRLVVIP